MVATKETPGVGEQPAPPDPMKHQGLIRAIAKKYECRGLSRGDLIAEGQVGLMTACQKFDPSRGVTFSTYATPWIHKSISRAIEEQVPLLAVPVNIQEKVRYANSKSYGSEASVKAGRQAMQRHVNERTISILFGEKACLDTVAFGGRERDLDRRIAALDLAVLMRCLRPLEADVLRMRYGLGNTPELSVAEIGHKLGKFRQAVYQIENQALDRLRAMAGAA